MDYLRKIFFPGLVLGLISLVYCALNGLLPFVFIAWCLISGLGIAVGFHRVYSHKTHRPKLWLDYLLLGLGTLGGQGSSIAWTAIHRGVHHRFSDTEKDFHSPIHGIFSSLVGWYTKVNETNLNFVYAGGDLLRKKHHMWVHAHYNKIIYGFVGVLFILAAPLAAIYLAALFLSLVQDNLVNCLCHIRKLGYKNFATKDNSVNFWPLGYFGWGQGWHENHHHDPASFDFGKKWWEFDPCRIFLPLLKLGSYAKSQ